jgi:hypothetical protein
MSPDLLLEQIIHQILEMGEVDTTQYRNRQEITHYCTQWAPVQKQPRDTYALGASTETAKK